VLETSPWPGITTKDLHNHPVPRLLFPPGTSQETYPNSATIPVFRNSLGYRTAEFDSVGEHVLCLGDSRTEGMGLLSSERWSDLVGQQLECDVVNLGVRSISMDAIYLLAAAWVQHRQPLAVVVQTPPMVRHSVWHDVAGVPRAHWCNLHSNSHRNQRDKKSLSAAYMNLAEASIYNFEHAWVINLLAVQNLCAAKQIPYFAWSFDTKEDQNTQVFDLCEILGAQVEHNQYNDKNNSLPIGHPMANVWPENHLAADDAHSDADCNQKWAQRVILQLPQLR